VTTAVCKQDQRQDTRTTANAPRATVATAPKRYSSESLFGGARQVIIQHGEREYCLRVTAANKLILTA
jgi:hemin uptake protein HemP